MVDPVAKENTLKPRLNHPKSVKDAYRAEIIDMVNQGMPAKEIAEKLGCTYRNVYYAMKAIRLESGEITMTDTIYQLRNRVKALEVLVAKLATQINRRIPCVDPAPASVPDTESDTRQGPKPPNRRDYMMG